MSIQDIANKLNLTDIDLVAPEVVVSEYVSQLNEITQHYVKGSVEKYKGSIVSYKTNGLASITSALSGVQEHNIQNDLGTSGYEQSRFECYLTGTELSDYKFRICFFEYGLGGYPVKFVLEQYIADEINRRENSSYIFKLNGRAQLTDLLDKIFSTKKILEIIQGLINESIIIRNRNPENDEVSPHSLEDKENTDT